jgi:hypothetical protein
MKMEVMNKPAKITRTFMLLTVRIITTMTNMIRIMKMKLSIRRTDVTKVTNIAMKLELMIITIKMKIMIIMINRMMYPGSCVIIGMRVDVLINKTMTKNPRKPLRRMRLNTRRIQTRQNMKKTQMTTTLLNKTFRVHRIDYIYHEVNNQENRNGGGNDRIRGANGSNNFHRFTVHLDVINVFYLPTDAQ